MNASFADFEESIMMLQQQGMYSFQEVVYTSRMIFMLSVWAKRLTGWELVKWRRAFSVEWFEFGYKPGSDSGTFCCLYRRKKGDSI